MDKEDRYTVEFFLPEETGGGFAERLYTARAIESLSKNALEDALRGKDWVLVRATHEKIRDYDTWRMQYGWRHRICLDFGTVKTRVANMYEDALTKLPKYVPKERPYRPALNIPDVTVSRAWVILALAILFVFVILLL